MKHVKIFLFVILVFSCKEKESREIHYPNGNLKSKTTFDAEKIDSLRKGYYKNGKLKYIKHFKDSQVVFKKSYAKDGELLSKSREVNVLLENDTITLGEKIRFKFIPYGKIDTSKRIVVLILKRNMYEKMKNKDHDHFGLTQYHYHVDGKLDDINFIKIDSSELIKKIASPRHSKVKLSYTPFEEGKHYLFSSYIIEEKRENSGDIHSLPIEFYVKK